MMNNKNKFFRAIIILITFCCNFAAAQITPENKTGLETISGNEIKEHITFLADDNMKGRAAGSDECLLSAMFIAKKFQAAGLEPMFKGKYWNKKNSDLSNVEIALENRKKFNPFFQKFNIQKSKLAKENSLAFNFKFDEGFIEVKYQYGDDYFINYRGLEDLIINAPLVFAGYGIEKGENGYNDYLDRDGNEIDVKDKLVLIIDDYPQSRDPNSIFVKAEKKEYTLLKYKGRTALEKGALGVLVLPSPFSQGQPVSAKISRFIGAFEKDYTKLHNSDRNSIPLIYLTQKASYDLYKKIAGGELISVLNEIDNSLKPAAENISGITCKLNININYEVLPTQNVVGYLEGTDDELKNELIVIGAHYDHVGLGYYGAMNKENAGQIHNGADDNASGVSGVIELAEAFSKNPPKRSLLFIAFGAEENGLLGSRFYVKSHPALPLNQTVAMLNLDMVGRNEPELLWIGGVFQGRDIIRTVEQANEDIGFELLYNVGMMSKASDQAFFLQEKIPAVFFFSGLHDDYHCPSDDVDKIDFHKVERVAKLAYLTGWTLANQTDKPKYEDIPIKERAGIVKESGKRMKKYRKAK